MWIDIVYLNKFYKSDLGIFTQKTITRALEELWEIKPHHRILGLGYAPPFLQTLSESVSHCIAAMPSYQGATPWPSSGPCRTTLIHEHELPFQDTFFDKILLVHMMGYTAHVKEMLREAWRVLADEGEIVLIVPNRFGIWSHIETTPFGQSMPYTSLQLKHILVESCFIPLESRKVLYTPPIRNPTLLKLIAPLEGLCQRWINVAPGVLIVKAKKQVYAKALPIKAKKWARALAPR